MKRPQFILVDILLSMEVGHVWNKDVVIRMIYPKGDYIHNYYYTRRKFDTLLSRAKSRILYAQYRTNANNQIKRLL